MCDVTSAKSGQHVYGRSYLASLYTTLLSPCPAVIERLRQLGLKATCRLHCTRRCLHVRRYRGCRSWRPRRPSPVLRDAGNGAAVITGNRPALRDDVPSHPRPPLVRRPIHLDRHSTSAGRKHLLSAATISVPLLTSWTTCSRYAAIYRSTCFFLLKLGMMLIP